MLPADLCHEKLKETILIVKEEMGFEIYAYCFMSNHVWINVNKVDRKKWKNYTLINIASFSLGVRPSL